MARKKIKIRISFNDEKFAPTTSTLEKAALLQSFKFGQPPIVKVWTDSEVFNGTSGETSHISWIKLRLLNNGTQSFSHKLSNGSNYVASFNNFIEFSTLSFTFSEEGISVKGSMVITLSILQEMLDDVTKSGLLYFDQFGFIAKNNTDLLEFSKYGHQWEKEREEEDLYSKGNSVDFISGRPKIEII